MKRFGSLAWLWLCLPVLLGVLVMVGCRAPVARWGVHLGAGLLGLALYGLVTATRWRPSRDLTLMLAAVAALTLASTLLSSGIEGMRRWHELGALRVHPSAMFAPALLVVAAGELARRSATGHALLLAVQVLHVVQPDAGQATAFGLGAMTLVLAESRHPFKYLLVCAYLVSIVATWLRFDPLPPAAFVEDIVQRAFALAPVAGVAGLALLTLLVVSPLLGAGRGRALPAALALSGYFAGSLVATRFGEFPVPLLGFGTSPIVGAFLGLALLRRFQAASGTPEKSQPLVQTARQQKTSERSDGRFGLIPRWGQPGSGGETTCARVSSFSLRAAGCRPAAPKLTP